MSECNERRMNTSEWRKQDIEEQNTAKDEKMNAYSKGWKSEYNEWKVNVM